LIEVLKFIHLLLTLSLLGSTLFCLILISLKKRVLIHSPHDDIIIRLNRIMLWLLVFAVLTGTLLVYPKHFTFHTPWIKAAYLLVFLFGTLVSLLTTFRKKNMWRWSTGLGYLMLIMMLIGIVHDAVTKTSFLF